MSVFISYKRENQDAVQRLVEALRDAGLKVWWDQDIAPDAPWEATIEAELEKAKVVVVCWSRAAVASENVKAEARRARNQGKLIQTYVEPCDPPLFFGERQGVDLSDWNGNASDNRFAAVLAASRAILAGRRPPEGVGYRPRKRAPWAALAGFFVVASALLGFIADVGGARDTVCSVNDGVRRFCVEIGLIAQTEAELRAALMRGLVGDWGRAERDCSVTTRFSVSEADGIYRIRSVSPPDFDNTLQVNSIDADRRIVTARTTRPGASGVREQWEFHLNGDLMQVIGPDLTATPLARCGE
jgi:hypothetical protein